MYCWLTTSTSLPPLHRLGHLRSLLPKNPSSHSPDLGSQLVRLQAFTVAPIPFALRHRKPQVPFQEDALHVYPWPLEPQEPMRMPPNLKACKWSVKCVQGFVTWSRSSTPKFPDFGVEHLIVAHLLDVHRIWLPKSLSYQKVLAGFW